MTGNLHTKCPKCSMKKRAALESRRVAKLIHATGGIRRREASGDIVINSFDIWVLSASGVEKGLRSPPPGWSAAI